MHVSVYKGLPGYVRRWLDAAAKLNHGRFTLGKFGDSLVRRSLSCHGQVPALMMHVEAAGWTL